MAFALPENWSTINGSDDFDQFEIPEIDSALLMSLLEEQQGEECDDESLRRVMQSLEAVIDPNGLEGHDSLAEMEWGSNLNGCPPSDGGQVDGQDCSTSRDADFNWMMDVEMVLSSPSDHDMANWYMDRDDIDHGIIEFGDYSQICYGMALEEHEYGSLWQESHSSVMHG